MSSSTKPASRLAIAVSLALPLALKSQEPTGCFFYDFRFESLRLNVPMPLHPVGDKYSCQARCAETTGCETFTYDKIDKNCWLGSLGLSLVPTGGSVSGPKTCPQVPGVCTDLPGEGFPGATVASSFNAWPSGVQPLALQCWPRDQDDKLVPCTATPVTVLDDIKTGWPGKCWDLKVNKEPQKSTCGEDCRASMYCPSYQTRMVGEPAKMLCLQGVGSNCNSTRKPRTIDVLSSERLMHGSYRVLKAMKDFTVEGLVNIAPPAESRADEGAAVQDCKHTCLSALHCEYWQYSRTYGCYVDVPSPQHEEVGYPGLLGTVYVKNDQFASTIVAGEYIQRFCGTPATASGVSTKLIQWGTTTTTTVAVIVQSAPVAAVSVAAPVSSVAPAAATVAAKAPPMVARTVPAAAAAAIPVNDAVARTARAPVAAAAPVNDAEVQAELDEMMGLKPPSSAAAGSAMELAAERNEALSVGAPGGYAGALLLVVGGAWALILFVGSALRTARLNGADDNLNAERLMEDNAGSLDANDSWPRGSLP